MSTATPTAEATKSPAGQVRRNERVTFGGLLRSEWIKFWSLRSTIWTLSVSSFVLIATVVLSSWGFVSAQSHRDMGFVPLDAFSNTVILGPLAVAVLGALTITGEYATGMIRSTFTAAPRRLPAVWAKGAVLALAVLGVTTATVAAAAGLQWVFFHGKGFSVDATDPQILRSLFGNALYVTATGLLAYALGLLMRHSAAAIATVMGLLIVVPIVFQVVPWHVLQHDLMPFLPNIAGSQITQPDAAVARAAQQHPDDITLSAWQGFGVMLAWVAAALVPAAILVKKRDA